MSSIITIKHISKNFTLSSMRSDHHIILAASIANVLLSPAFIASSMALPKGSFYGAIGNSVTCTIQGFAIPVGFSMMEYYLTVLCIFYYVTICKYYNPVDFQRKIALYCHLFCIGSPLIGAVVMAKLGFVGAAYDHDCYCYAFERSDAQEGKNILFIVFFTHLLPGAIAAGAVVYLMFSIYKLMTRRHQASLRNFLASSSGILLILKENALNQAFLFSCAILLNPLILALMYIPSLGYWSGGAFHATLLLLQSVFLPSQGIWLFLIYVRPFVARILMNYRNLSYTQALVRLVTNKYPIEVRSYSSNRAFGSPRELHDGSNTVMTAAPTFEVRDEEGGNSFDISSVDESSISSMLAIASELRHTISDGSHFDIDTTV